ncbi:MAG: Na+/H+ antiporter subunit E [Deltaproteobacteria bacterium]|nr:Na+/H+ antiporter subunit E [Deltaproteobacteria bacterium]
MASRIKGPRYDSPREDQGRSVETVDTGKHSASPAVITFLGLFCLWIVLSGKLDFFHLTLGLISCLIVTTISKDLLFPHSSTQGLFRSAFRFSKYIPWLVYKIFMANLHVLALTFHPRMMDRIDPQVFRFQSRLKKDMALVTFANSITLTPGTITVYVNINGMFTVHALDWKSREGLPGEMENRIAAVFEEA